MTNTKYFWNWEKWRIAWILNSKDSSSKKNVLLIHGFGASKYHWRFNQTFLGNEFNCFSIDLLGFGESSQPKAIITGDTNEEDGVHYSFDLWSKQIEDFTKEIIKGPVFLVGNSIGGVIALKAAKELKELCNGLALINCAQRQMDDKRLYDQPFYMKLTRPLLKSLVQKRWLSNQLFLKSAKPEIIRSILKKAYPTGNNIDDELIDILYKPTKRVNAKEAFRGFINLFDDYLATELMKTNTIPTTLIWGEEDPWESLAEAKEWKNDFSCIQELYVIPKCGHCPHDENPKQVNKILKEIIQLTV
tara:strand:- start:13271 stop:14179 length:909 start_codon:yes stop_codon:yes gene_type:complete